MPTMLFRAAEFDDLESLYQLAQNSGLTTLPKSKDLLATRLRASIEAFDHANQRPHHEYYWFVLENLDENKVVGTSAIEASIGRKTPFFAYQVVQQMRRCEKLGIQQQDTLLFPIQHLHQKSEICSLYLDPQYRHSHHGLLLSKARFLFMAQYPERFAKSVVAELRGNTDEQGNSPFWESLGRHLYPMSFTDADTLSLDNKAFLSELLPDYPINIKLLSPRAQAVIGQPHSSGKAAQHILLDEGFAANGLVDVFDAGPILEAPIDKIQTIQLSRYAQIKQIQATINARELYLLANTELNFRALVAPIILNNNDIIISQATADALQVQEHDTIRFATLTLKPLEDKR